MIKWNEYLIEQVTPTQKEMEDLFEYGAIVTSVDEFTPEEIAELQEGYYRIVETNQLFNIENHDTDWGTHTHCFYFGIRKPNVLHDYMNKLAIRAEEEKLGEALAEITEFKNDLDSELVFVHDIAQLKNYYGKLVEIKRTPDEEIGYYYNLLINDVPVVELYQNGKGEYTAYDGLDGNGWYTNIKKCVKAYMDVNYRYSIDTDDYDDVSCTNCGDGGCMYCEPNRFM